MSIKQISVFLQNKPSTLKQMTGVLAAHKIDMRALSLAETKDFGIARVIVDDVYDAVNVLKEEGFFNAEEPYVLSMEVTLRPGEDEGIVLANTKRVLNRAWALLED